MSHPQMNNGESIKFSYQENDVFGMYLSLLVECTEFQWEVHSILAIFVSINHFRRFHIKLTLKRRAKQHFPKHSRYKLLTPFEIVYHLIPYNFNSKGDNLRKVEFRIEAVSFGVSD